MTREKIIDWLYQAGADIKGINKETCADQIIAASDRSGLSRECLTKIVCDSIRRPIPKLQDHVI